jgi:ribosomal protein S21
MQNRRRTGKRYSPRDFVSPGNSLGVKIPDSSDFALEKGLRIFKRQIKESGKLLEVKARREYVKPTTARRKKMNDAKRRQALQHRKEVAFWGDTAWTTMVDGKPV